MNYELIGRTDAPVLVLGSSMGTTMQMWNPQLPALREHFQVLRFNHRGHGGSPAPSGPYSIDDLGRDMLDLLDSLGIERVSYCGLSLGGMVGMWLAGHAPERVERLVLCCTSVVLGPARSWLDRAEKARTQGMASIAEQVVARWFTPKYRRLRPDMVSFAAAMLCATNAEGYAGCCEAIAAMDLGPLLPAITAPTLVLAGAEDPAIPPEHGEVIARTIPDARLVVVPDAAHLANVEAAGQVTKELLHHLIPRKGINEQPSLHRGHGHAAQGAR